MTMSSIFRIASNTPIYSDYEAKWIRTYEVDKRGKGDPKKQKSERLNKSTPNKSKSEIDTKQVRSPTGLNATASMGSEWFVSSLVGGRGMEHLVPSPRSLNACSCDTCLLDWPESGLPYLPVLRRTPSYDIPIDYPGTRHCNMCLWPITMPFTCWCAPFSWRFFDTMYGWESRYDTRGCIQHIANLTLTLRQSDTILL